MRKTSAQKISFCNVHVEIFFMLKYFFELIDLVQLNFNFNDFKFVNDMSLASKYLRLFTL